MPSPELRILQVIAPAPIGGLESVVAALSLGLARRGHLITVSASVDPSGGPYPLLELLECEGVRVVRAGGGYRAEASALPRVAKEAGADLAHSHGYRSDVLLRVARTDRLPLVTTLHGFTGGNFKNRMYERLEVLALRRFEAVVVVSEPLRRRARLAGIAEQQVHLVPNAYAALYPPDSRSTSRMRLGLPARGTVIGWVGRLSREKGADVALEALAQLAGRDWMAVFVGDGPERTKLERQATELGIGSRVRWLGNFAGAGAVMPAFDVLLSSSRTEGTPVVLLEAAAVGVPIVATAVGGVPALLRDIGGVPAAPPEAPGALAALLASMIDVPDDAARIGIRQREGLAAPARFEAWLDRYEEIYRGAIARKDAA